MDLPTHRTASRVPRLLMLLVAGCALLACASLSFAQDPLPEDWMVSVDEAPQSQAEDEPIEWLEDEQGQYRLDKIPRIEGMYHWVDRENLVVKVKNLFPVTAHSFDEDFFYVRVNRMDQPFVPPPERHIPTSEPLPEVPEMPTVDRLDFRSFGNGLPRRGQWRNTFDLADMNGDGHLDLIHGPPRKGFSKPYIFLGDDQGNWRVWREARFPDAQWDYGGVVAADFDLDGHQDLAFGIHLQGLIAVRGDGEGNFTLFAEGLPMVPAHSDRKTPFFTTRMLATTDWDRDGRTDILALSEGPTSVDQLAEETEPLLGKAIYLNRGNGTWEPLGTRDANDSVFGDKLAVVDLNGDDWPDFVTDTASAGNRFILNLHPGDPEAPWVPTELEALRGRPLVTAVWAGDLDGSGRADLVISYRARLDGLNRNIIEAMFAEEEGWRREPLWIRPVQQTISALGGGDLDGDGHTDLVLIERNGRVEVLLGTAGGGFEREDSPELQPTESYLGCRSYRVVFRDIDSDGDDEVLWATAGEPGSERTVLGPEAEVRCAGLGSIYAFTASGRNETSRGAP